LQTAAQLLHSGPKVIDWANDDDDWGDMMIQPEFKPNPATVASTTSKTATTLATPSSENAAAKTNGISSASAPSHGKQNGDHGKGQGSQQRERLNVQRSNKQQQQHEEPASTKGGGVEVDDDGFIVASSKRTKMQQQQQQQAFKGNNRGGRGGGNASRGGRGGFQDGSFKGQSGRGGGQARGRGAGRGE